MHAGALGFGDEESCAPHAARIDPGEIAVAHDASRGFEHHRRPGDRGGDFRCDIEPGKDADARAHQGARAGCARSRVANRLEYGRAIADRARKHADFIERSR